MHWLIALREAAGILPTHLHFNTAIAELKLASSGFHTIDEIFKEMPFRHINNEAHVNGVPFRKVTPELRLGEINSAFHQLRMREIPLHEEAAFKKILEPEVPDFKLANMTKKIESCRKVHEDLRVVATTAEELKAKLSPAAAAKVKSSWAKIIKGATLGSVIVGVITATVVVADAYQGLVKATQQRNGCFITYIQNGHVQSCKIMRKSCINKEGRHPCDNNVSSLLADNIWLLVYNSTVNNDTELLADIKAKTGLELTKSNASATLSNQTSIQKLLEYYENMQEKPKIADPCGLAGVTQGCVACDTSAAHNSPAFVDDSNLPQNMKIHCVTDSNVMDTIIDFGENIGRDVLDGLGGSLSNSISPLFSWLVGIILLLIVLIFSFLKLGSKNTAEIKVSTPPPLNYHQTSVF